MVFREVGSLSIHTTSTRSERGTWPSWRANGTPRAHRYIVTSAAVRCWRAPRWSLVSRGPRRMAIACGSSLRPSARVLWAASLSTWLELVSSPPRQCQRACRERYTAGLRARVRVRVRVRLHSSIVNQSARLRCLAYHQKLLSRQGPRPLNQRHACMHEPRERERGTRRARGSL